MHGKYYHVFNRGVNSCATFFEKKDYYYFLEAYKKYIPKIADTFAYCLMKNHFHFLIRIKEENEIEFISVRKPYNPSRQFSHFFNAYTRWFNISHDRTGPLFERPFKRKSIDSDRYLKQIIGYIHTNPIHHGISTELTDFPWTSYRQLTTGKMGDKPFPLADAVSWFGDIDHFITYHKVNQENLNGVFDV